MIGSGGGGGSLRDLDLFRFPDYFYSQIYSVGIDRNNTTELFADTGIISHPQFSSEDNLILYGRSYYYGEENVYLIDINNKNVIYNEKGTEPKFSHDRKKFMYQKSPGELYIVNLDGSEHDKLTPVQNPSFFPDDYSIILDNNICIYSQLFPLSYSSTS